MRRNQYLRKNEKWDSVVIRHSMNNALKVEAYHEGRSITMQLDWMLKKAGVEEIDDDEMINRMVRIRKGKEILVAK